VRPDWNEIFRYEPNGTICHKHQVTGRSGRRKMDKPVGYFDKDGYLVFKFKGKLYRVNVVIWEMRYGPVTPGMEIDHRNNIRNDNRIENLQELTHRENATKQLISKANKTGYKGVTFYKKRNKFRASIKFNHKSIHLGYFNTPEEAYEARKAAELHYFGSKLMVSQ
jgi:hypothetical protein